jgi:hypothetical protein
VDDQDESTHKNTGETGEEVQDLGPAFKDDLDVDVDDIEIEMYGNGSSGQFSLFYPCFEYGVWMSSRGLCQELQAQGVP